MKFNSLEKQALNDFLFLKNLNFSIVKKIFFINRFFLCLKNNLFKKHSFFNFLEKIHSICHAFKKHLNTLLKFFFTKNFKISLIFSNLKNPFRGLNAFV